MLQRKANKKDFWYFQRFFTHTRHKNAANVALHEILRRFMGSAKSWHKRCRKNFVSCTKKILIMCILSKYHTSKISLVLVSLLLHTGSIYSTSYFVGKSVAAAEKGIWKGKKISTEVFFPGPGGTYWSRILSPSLLRLDIIFICGAADRSGRGKRYSSCCCCWGSLFIFTCSVFFWGGEKKCLKRGVKKQQMCTSWCFDLSKYHFPRHRSVKGSLSCLCVPASSFFFFFLSFQGNRREGSRK